MTLERPMFPPRQAEECTVINFCSFKNRAHQGALQAFRDNRKAKLEAQIMQLATPEKLTVSCRNLRLRQVRHADWRTARHVTDYWRARCDWRSALQIAQMRDVADSRTFAKDESDHGFALVSLWRVALVNQMLTPAPTAAAVAWKQAAFRRGQHRYVDVKPEIIEAAIANDIEWLKAHPTRRAGGAS
jgi:hypothetical protein